jgi:hypothetical protein
MARKPYRNARQEHLAQLDELKRAGRLDWRFGYDEADHRAIFHVRLADNDWRTLDTKTAEGVVQSECDGLGLPWHPVAHPGGESQREPVVAWIAAERHRLGLSEAQAPHQCEQGRRSGRGGEVTETAAHASLTSCPWRKGTRGDSYDIVNASTCVRGVSGDLEYPDTSCSLIEAVNVTVTYQPFAAFDQTTLFGSGGLTTGTDTGPGSVVAPSSASTKARNRRTQQASLPGRTRGPSASSVDIRVGRPQVRRRAFTGSTR